MKGPSNDTRRVNEAYYGSLEAGRDDYWRKMAAPRLRMSTFLRLMRTPPPARLIDLGCGNGRLLEEVARRHPSTELSGIDLSEEQIAANRRARPEITWHIADLTRHDSIPPGLHDRFDTVVASELIEHVEDPARFLRNALAVAAPGEGRLLLSTQSGPVRETERRVGHHRHFSRLEMTDLLQRSGWRPLKVWNCGFPFHDLSKWWANRDPDKSMARFSDRAYGVSENLVCMALRAAFLFNSRRRGAQLFAVAIRRDG